MKGVFLFSDNMNKFLIAGLGNIGEEYYHTRHNIGFMVLNHLAEEYKAVFELKKQGFVADIKVKGKTITLLKPTTYMNLSGKAIRYWLKEKKVPVENLLVITDDVAIDFAKLRTKKKGSSGGHNGLKNTEELLATQQYARMRVGIGNDYPKGRQVDFVLSRFNDKEMEEMPFLLDRASKGTISFCLEGVDRMMNQYNG